MLYLEMIIKNLIMVLTPFITVFSIAVLSDHIVDVIKRAII